MPFQPDEREGHAATPAVTLYLVPAAANIELPRALQQEAARWMR